MLKTFGCGCSNLRMSQTSKKYPIYPKTPKNQKKKRKRNPKEYQTNQKENPKCPKHQTKLKKQNKNADWATYPQRVVKDTTGGEGHNGR